MDLHTSHDCTHAEWLFTPRMIIRQLHDCILIAWLYARRMIVRTLYDYTHVALSVISAQVF